MGKLNVYDLSRNFWDFAFENPSKIKPTHCALYFFAIEHCNRLGWKEEFGLPTSMVIEAIGIKSYSVYKKTFDELVEFGFIEVAQYSKNQYSSNIIALKENCKANDKANCKAHDKALDKALSKHVSKHLQSNMSINRQIHNNTNIQEYNNTEQQQNKNILLSAVEENSIQESEKRFYEIATSFQDMLIEKFTSQKLSCRNIENAKYVNWINDIRLMLETDKRSVDDIRQIWNFLKKETIGEDDFAWFLNIQSMSKLRVQFEKVLNKAKISQNGTITRKQQATNSGIQDEIRRATEQMLGVGKRTN